MICWWMAEWRLVQLYHFWDRGFSWNLRGRYVIEVWTQLRQWRNCITRRWIGGSRERRDISSKIPLHFWTSPFPHYVVPFNSYKILKISWANTDTWVLRWNGHSAARDELQLRTRWRRRTRRWRFERTRTRFHGRRGWDLGLGEEAK